MPKSSRPKFYAVNIGREGRKIYTTWDECKRNVDRYPGSVHKSFNSRSDAEKWLETLKPPRAPPLPTSAPPLRPPFNPGRPSTSPSSDLTRNSISQTTRLSESHIDPHPACSPNVASSPLAARPTGVLNKLLSIGMEDTVVRDGVHSGETSQRPLQVSDRPDVVEAVKPVIALSAEQQAVLQKVKEGRSIFFTGSAGTGKSVLLREIIQMLRNTPTSVVAITASTGIASVNIGGTTLHSWAGIGLGQEKAKDLAGKMFGQRPMFDQVIKRWRSVTTLIIDEISMIDGALFDKLEELARILRHNQSPFGGIQLVLSGDFCQLPPVPDQRSGVLVHPRFAFDANSWYKCVREPIQLTHVFRQKEQDFVEMLNAMRFGQLSPKMVEQFSSLARPITYDDGIEPTELFATRREVEMANISRLNQLSGTKYIFNATDVPGKDSNNRWISSEQADRLLQRLVAAQSITLKVGAQVMLIKNLVQGELVNGSVGQIIRFSTAKEAAEAKTEIANAGDPSTPASLKTSLTDDPSRHWPVVRFTSGMTMLITSHDFTVNNALGEVEARREQVPLILAWALSVHKSQGQTLERVRVDLRSTFEKGQAYVALSRATSMKTLQVLHFNPARVMVHPRVLEWHKKIKEPPIAVDDVDDDDDFAADYHNAQGP